MTPTVFKIREQEVVASWPGSAKTCLGCKTTGHSTSLCPRRNPKMKKVGESVNPLQKIGKGGQSRKGKEKESEVSTGSSEKMKAPAPATRTTPATIASGSASGKAIQPPKPPGSGAPKKSRSNDIGDGGGQSFWAGLAVRDIDGYRHSGGAIHHPSPSGSSRPSDSEIGSGQKNGA